MVSRSASPAWAGKFGAGVALFILRESVGIGGTEVWEEGSRRRSLGPPESSAADGR